MMSTMMKKSYWQRATDRVLEKAGQKAIRKNRPLKTYSAKDLQWYLEHGWKVLSMVPSSYGQSRYWLLVPA